jgi:hypothetical protein
LGATGTADIFADTSGGVVVGSGTNVAGETFRLDNTEVGNIRAASLSIFASTPGGASRPMTVQDLTFRDPAAVGFANAVRTIALYTDGQRIDVTGAVTGAGGNLTLGSPVDIEGFGWRPSVVRISGTLGTSTARLGAVRITAGDIYISPPETIDIESGALLAAYTGPPTVQIAANNLTLDATRTIQQRNLQSNVFTLTDGIGLEVDGLTISGPTLTQVALFGRLGPLGSGQIVDIGAALAIGFQGTGPYNVSFTPTPGVGNNFRFNTCVIGGGGGCAVFLAPFTVPALPDPDELGDLTDPYAIVDDEPVTSSGGEILWPSPDDTDDEEEDGE